MSAPAFQWRGVFVENRVEVFSSNYALYGDMSRQVMTVLREQASSPARSSRYCGSRSALSSSGWLLISI